MRALKWTAAALVGGLLANGPAFAFGDMGRAPTDQGWYVSGEGGFLWLDDTNIAAFGFGPAGGPLRDAFLSPEDGWFAGGMIGYADQQPIIFGFKRIEGYFLYGEADDSISSSAAGLAMTSVVGDAITVGGSRANGSAERSVAEGGLHFERDSTLNSSTILTWVVNPWIRLNEEDSQSAILGGCCVPHRNSDVDTWMYGVNLAVEPEMWISRSIAIVGRGGVGIYGYDADGSFKSFSNVRPDPFAARVSDSDSGVGFRGQLGAGLKFKVWQTGLLETFAEADYFSDVGSANMPTNTTVTFKSAGIDMDDQWEFRTGARLTFALGGPPPPPPPAP